MCHRELCMILLFDNPFKVMLNGGANLCMAAELPPIIRYNLKNLYRVFITHVMRFYIWNDCDSCKI